MNKRIFIVVFVCLSWFIGINKAYSDGYVLSYFGGSDGKEALYLAYSFDALNWTALNNNKPLLYASLGYKSIRDPYIIRKEDGKYELLCTNSDGEYILVWDSDDLTTFKNERLVHLNNIGQHTWAPECIYDKNTKEYVIYWSGNTAIYCNRTMDFINLSPAELLFDPGYRSIDADITESDGTYYMFYKDESGNPSIDTAKYRFLPESEKRHAIKEAKSGSLQAGSFKEFTPKYITEHLTEGPACIKDLKKDRWYLYYDLYTLGGFWGCSVTDDLTTGKWRKMDKTEYKLPAGVRHGNAVKVSDDELKKVIESWK